MIALWIYVALTLTVFFRIGYVLHRDGAVQLAGWKRVLRVLILDTVRWPYYVLRYGVEAFLRDLR